MKKIYFIFLLTLSIIGCANDPVGPISESQASKMSIDKLNAAIIKDSNNVNLHLARANYFANHKSLDFAQEEYKIVLNMKPSNVDIELVYANFLCNKKYDPYTASSFYVQALRDGGIESQAQIYNDYAGCMIASEDFAKGQELYLKSLSYDNPPLSAYIGLVTLYTKQGNYAIANYYASLYSGVATKESLEMQLTAIDNLLYSDPMLANSSELKAKYNKLNQQYFDLTQKKFATMKNTVIPDSATIETP